MDIYFLVRLVLIFHLVAHARLHLCFLLTLIIGVIIKYCFINVVFMNLCYDWDFVIVSPAFPE